MRCHIDTAPVLDAMRAGGECPLCLIRAHVEETDVERCLGASVMEPDTRVRVNKTGFCVKHHQMLAEQKNKLGHALMTDTHLRQCQTRVLSAFKKGGSAGGLFNKKGDPLKETAAALRSISQGCVICDSVDENMRRYAYTFLYLYKSEEAFRKDFAASKGLCIPDSAKLLDMASEELPQKMREPFAREVERLLNENLARIEKELEWFTLKFDYRNADKPFGESKDALERAILKLRAGQIK